MSINRQNILSSKNDMFKKLMLQILTFAFIIVSIQGCTNSLNQKNYFACKLKLENDRQKARLEERYSYNSYSYQECRAPANYVIGQN